MFNRKLCAQQEIIMCSTGHYWGVQREVMSSTRNYNVLNWKLLECSTGIYNLLSWTLLGCSMGIQVLNRNLGAQWELMCPMGIIICSTGHYLGAQWEVMCSTGNYNVLNWTLLGCSTGNYNVLNWTLLGCSTGSYVLNRKL